MKRRRASHMSGTCENAYPVDSRLERRWKRRERDANAMIVSFKDNCFASATKTTAKISENEAVLTDKNDRMLEVDVDVDYKEYLEKYLDKDKYASDMDSTSDNNGVSVIDIATGYNNETRGNRDYMHDSETDTDNHDTEEDYEIHLDGLVVSDIEVDETDADNDEEMDAEYKEHFDENGSDIEADATDSDNDETNAVADDETDAVSDEIDGEYKEHFNEKGSDVEADVTDSDDDETDANDDETDYESDSEDFLTPARNVDGDSVQDASNSSDSDIILIEPSPICEDTPFIYSKTYDSSWFEKEMKGKGGKHLSSGDRSQFRRRLMEYLQRPYDQQEYCLFLKAVNQRKQKERHVETRQGVIKSYHAEGCNKSYLELYPDLAKAIAEFNKPHRVLFLLRGFIFWLKNLCHEGTFRPWLDESCLEALRKM